VIHQRPKISKNTNFPIFANYQLSCFIRSRQSVESDFRPNFRSAWTNNTIRQNETDRHVTGKVLAWLDSEVNISSWNWNFFMTEVVGNIVFSFVDIRGTIHLQYLFYSNIWKQDSRTLTVPPGQKNESSRFAMFLRKLT